MRILIYDEVQKSDAPDSLKSASLADRWTGETVTINFENPVSFLEAVGIGGTDAGEVTLGAPVLITGEPITDKISIHKSITSPDVTRKFNAPGANITGMGYDPVNKKLITCDTNTDRIYIHDGVGPDIQQEISAITNPNAVCVDLDGNLLTASQSGEITRFDGYGPAVLEQASGFPPGLSGIAVDPANGDLLTVNESDNPVRVYRYQAVNPASFAGAIDYTFVVKDGLGLTLDSVTGDLFISGIRAPVGPTTYRIYQFDGISNNLKNIIDAPGNNPATGITIAEDIRVISLGTDEKPNYNNGLYRVLPAMEGITELSISHDGTYLGRFAAGDDRRLGESVTREPGFFSTSSPRRSLSGQVIAGTGGYEGRVMNYDFRSKIKEPQFRDLENAYSGLAAGLPVFVQNENLKINPWKYFYGSIENIEDFILQSSVNRFEYSRKLELREAF